MSTAVYVLMKEIAPYPECLPQVDAPEYLDCPRVDICDGAPEPLCQTLAPSVLGVFSDLRRAKAAVVADNGGAVTWMFAGHIQEGEQHRPAWPSDAIDFVWLQADEDIGGYHGWYTIAPWVLDGGRALVHPDLYEAWKDSAARAGE